VGLIAKEVIMIEKMVDITFIMEILHTSIRMENVFLMIR